MACKIRNNIQVKNDLSDTDGAKSQIMISATQLFAHKGYQKTTIRAISKRSGCNVSSFNYHFHSKELLYEKVFKSQIHSIVNSIITSNLSQHIPDCHPLENDLNTILKRLTSLPEISGHQNYFMDIFYQEMIDPHLPQNFLINKLIVPVKDYLGDLFRKNLPNLEKESMDLCVFSFIGQLLHFINLNHLFVKSDNLLPIIQNSAKTLKHIAEFTSPQERSIYQ